MAIGVLARGRHRRHLAEHAAPAADREPAQAERGNEHRRRHRLAAADADVAAQDAALTRAGQPPTSIFTGAYAEAGALDVYGAPYHLPPVVSGHNTFWLWGPGDASDTTVLYVDAAGQLKPYFASCRQLAVYNPPDQVKNDWNDLPIGVCTGPSASWTALWPHLRHYD